MSNSVTLNGISYLIPDVGEGGWGEAVTDYLVALSTGVLQKAGGTFTLTASVDFGATYGLRSAYYTSRTANLASTGAFRMARSDVINWRNQADSANLSLAVNSSDQLTFDGNPISSLALGAANTVLKVNAGGTDTEYGLLANANIAASGTADIALNKLAAMTASRAAVSDGSGYLTPSAVTATELALLSGKTALVNEVFTTRGDIDFRNATVRARLAIGADKAVLQSDGTDPAWVDLATAIEETHTIGNLSSTGLISGGVLSINADTSKYDISAGTGLVVDNYTDPSTPTYTHVTWTTFTAQSPALLGSTIQTFIGIDSGGNIVEMDWTDRNNEFRDAMFLGVLIHTDMATITVVNPGTNSLAWDIPLALWDLGNSIGPINESGNIYSANGSNLNMDKSAGVGFILGSNRAVSLQDPNRIAIASGTALSFVYTYDDGAGGWTFSAATTAIVPGKYDDGSGTLANVSNNVWTVQRIYLGSITVVHYGQATYATKAAAIDGIQTEAFSLNPDLDGALIRSYLIVKGNGTDLSDTGDAVFVAAGKFGGAGGNGGTSSTTNLQQAYDNSSQPQIVVNATGGGVIVQDASSPIGANLASWQSNGGGTTYFGIDVNGFNGTSFLDEDDMSSDSAVKVASQQSIKAYIDHLRTGKWDAIVDASGLADYTSIRTAIQTEAAGASIFVLDGAYAETSGTTIKELQKIYGQSKDGVVLTYTGSSGTYAFKTVDHTLVRWTPRNSDNSAWDTAENIGMVTMTGGGSTAGSYDGATQDLAVGDMLCLGGQRYFEIATVDTGADTFTVTEEWHGTDQPIDALTYGLPSSLTDPTVFENMTIKTSGPSIKAFQMIDSFNCRLSNLKLVGLSDDLTGFQTSNAVNCRFDNIEYTSPDNAPGEFIQCTSGGMSDCHWTNCIAILDDIELHGNTVSIQPIKHCTFHFIEAIGGSSDDMIDTPSWIVDCLFQFDRLFGITPLVTDPQAVYADFYGCIFKFGISDFTSSASSDFNAANCIFQMGLFKGDVDITDSAGLAEKNIITDGHITGTLVTDGNNIITSSLAVDTLSGGASARQVKGQAFSATNTLTDQATIATDCNLGNVHEVTLTDNRTLGAPTNMKDGATYIWVITQDGGGTNTLAYNAVFLFPGGTAPTLSTGGGDVDILSGWCDGTNIYATLQEDFS